MHRTTELIHRTDAHVGGNPEDRCQVAEPCCAVRLDIPFPADGFPRLHGQPEPIVRDVAFGFSAPELRDVEARPDEASEGAVGDEQRCRVVEEPAVLAVMPAEPILHHERFTTVEGANVYVKAALEIFTMNTVGPAVSNLGFERTSGEVEPLLVEVGAALVDTGNPD